MPNRSLAEILLARAVGPTRAAAIIGDLLELAATRGRLWYWTAYVRTLVSFTWRSPAAFLVAFVTFFVLYRLNMTIHHPGLRNVLMRHVVLGHPYVRQGLGIATFQLWFLVPFAAARYGIRDRFVKLGFAILVIASCAYYCVALPVLPLVLAALSLLAIAVLLFSAQWRGASIAVAAAIALGIGAYFNLQYLAHLYCWIYAHKPLNATSHYGYFEAGYSFPHPIFWIVAWAVVLLNMLTLSFVCSRLHSRLWLPSARDAEA